jgi:hypothetical protein
MPSWLEVRPLEEVVGMVTPGTEEMMVVEAGGREEVAVGGGREVVENGGEVDSEPRVTRAVIVVWGRIMVWVIICWRMTSADGLGFAAADRKRRAVIILV